MPLELYAQAFQQLASISAVLGGLAFTAAAALLAASAGSNASDALCVPAKVTVATAVASAVFLVIAALTWSLMAADVLRALAHENVRLANQIARLNRTPSFCMITGVALFFASIGTSGWIGSRRLGLVTSLAALVGLVALGVMVKVFADFG